MTVCSRIRILTIWSDPDLQHWSPAKKTHDLSVGNRTRPGHPGVLPGCAGRPADWPPAPFHLQLWPGTRFVSAAPAALLGRPPVHRGSITFSQSINNSHAKLLFDKCILQESGCKYYYDSIRKSVLGRRPLALKHCNRCNSHTQVSGLAQIEKIILL